MLNIEAMQFNAGTVKAERSANRGRGGRGDFSFATAMREAGQEPPVSSSKITGARKEPDPAPEETAIPAEMEERDEVEGAQQNTAAAELFSVIPPIVQQEAAPDEVPDERQQIVSILEGTSPDTDMTPKSAEAAPPEMAASSEPERETARMPQQQEAFALPTAESGTKTEQEQAVSAGRAERPVVTKDDSPCPLENENDTQQAQATPVSQSPEKSGREGESGQSERESFGDTPKEAPVSAKKPEEEPVNTGKARETSDKDTVPTDRPLSVPAERINSAGRFDAEVLGAQKAEQPVRPSELFDTMVERMNMVSNADSKVMTIQLRPEFLGKVQIQLTMTENGLSAKILTEDASVRGLINSQIGQLVESLSEKGVKVSGVEVLYTGVSDHEYDGSQSKQDAREQTNAGVRQRSRIVRVESALEMASVPYGSWEVADDGYYAENSSVEYTA